MAKRKSEKWRSLTDIKTRPPESGATTRTPFKIKLQELDYHGNHIVAEAILIAHTLYTAIGEITPEEMDRVIGWLPYKAKKGADGE